MGVNTATYLHSCAVAAGTSVQPIFPWPLSFTSQRIQFIRQTFYNRSLLMAHTQSDRVMHMKNILFINFLHMMTFFFSLFSFHFTHMDTSVICAGLYQLALTLGVVFNIKMVSL